MSVALCYSRRMSVSTTEFDQLTDPYRRELTAHCYRMIGSAHEAEDLVQETYLRAWRGYDRFEGRASLRTWLYKIATSACLTALEQRGRRPLPTGIGAPSDDPEHLGAPQHEVPWLQPFPDSVLEDDPENVATSRESIRLALIAALQYLPGKQRAVLILRDVLKWKAAEVAELLDTTVAGVNSALQRARARLDEIRPSEDDLISPLDSAKKELLERYAAAFERFDIDAITALLAKDAVWEMPPFPDWFVGSEHIGRLISANCPGAPGKERMVPTSANGQPAFALYMRDSEGVFRPFQIQVISGFSWQDDEPKVSSVVTFFDLDLFETFGLPDQLPADR